MKYLGNEGPLKPGRPRKKPFFAAHKSPYEGSMDYWEQYDPEKAVSNGHAVITESSAVEHPMCFLCGSGGRDQMVFCSGCCESFHPFCLEQEELPQTEEIEKNWTCKRCSNCRICGESRSKEKDTLRCGECCLTFHADCLQPEQAKKPDEDVPWVCFKCLRCKSCDKAEVAHYYEGNPMCATCCLQKKQGSFCPLCEGTR